MSVHRQLLLLLLCSSLSLTAACAGCSDGGGSGDDGPDAGDVTDADPDAGADAGDAGSGSDADAGTDGSPDVDPDGGSDADAGSDADPDADPDVDPDADPDVAPDTGDDCVAPEPACTSDEGCADGDVCRSGLCVPSVAASDYVPTGALQWVSNVSLGPDGTVTALDVDGDGDTENIIGTLVSGLPELRLEVEETLTEVIETGAFTVAMEVIVDEDVCGSEPGTRQARILLHSATRDLDYDGVPDSAIDPELQLTRLGFDEDGPRCQMNDGQWDPETGNATAAGGEDCVLAFPLFDGTLVSIPVSGLQMRFDDSVDGEKDGEGSVELGGFVRVEDLVNEANRLGQDCACAGIDTSSPVATFQVDGERMVARCVQDVSGAEAGCTELDDGQSCANLPGLCAAVAVGGAAADVESGDSPGVDDAFSVGLSATTEPGSSATPPVLAELQAVGDHYTANANLDWPVTRREATFDVLANDSFEPGVDTVQSVTVVSVDPEAADVVTTEIGTGGVGITVAPEWPGTGTGTITLEYVLGDGADRASTAPITLFVWGQTPSPTVEDDTGAMVLGEAALSLDVLANDSVVEGAELLFVRVAGEPTGTVAFDAETRQLTYEATASGTDTFGYVVQASTRKGGLSETVRSEVTVEVSCPEGTFGPDCAACPDCGLGTCNEGAAGDGLCACPDGAFGPSCQACPDCGLGTCNDGSDGDGLCVCPDGAFGASCQACPDCGLGTCNDGAAGDGLCVCPDGAYGPSCLACPDCGVGACNDGAAGDGLCVCPVEGYTGTGTTACTDINECTETELCPETSVCENTEGSYTCECPEGEVGTGGIGCVVPTSCEDSGSLLCLVGEQCVDLAVVEDFDCVPTGTLTEVSNNATFLDAGICASLGDDSFLLGSFPGEGAPPTFGLLVDGSWTVQPLQAPTVNAVSVDRSGSDLSVTGATGFGVSLWRAFGPFLESVSELDPFDLGADGDGFGESVGMYGDLVVVGAPFTDFGEGPGSVYLFDVVEDTLVASTPATLSRGAGLDDFGGSVAVGDGVIVVGAPLADVVVVYTADGEGGWDAQELSDDRVTGSTWFGVSVAVSVDGSRVVVGAPFADLEDPEAVRGAVFIYERGPAGYELDAAISGFGVESGFGDAVAVDGDRVVVGAPFEGGAAGAAFVLQYGRLSDAWVITDRFDGSAEAGFGTAVSAHAGRVLVTAPSESAVRVYEEVAAP